MRQIRSLLDTALLGAVTQGLVQVLWGVFAPCAAAGGMDVVCGLTRRAWDGWLAGQPSGRIDKICTCLRTTGFILWGWPRLMIWRPV